VSSSSSGVREPFTRDTGHFSLLIFDGPELAGARFIERALNQDDQRHPVRGQSSRFTPRTFQNP
jgi:hypothetical protein